MPLELETAGYIDRFGAQAVYGRAMGLAEMRAITAAENVVKWYQARAKHPDGWAAWAAANPEKSELLNALARLQNG